MMGSLMPNGNGAGLSIANGLTEHLAGHLQYFFR